MKLYAEIESGTRIEIERLQSIGEGDLIIKSNYRLNREDTSKLETELSGKTGRKVILLDGRFGEIFSIPPIRATENSSEQTERSD
ncbi:MAG: hypothetical protein PHP50_11095 [Lachnospiraceae bacterium]|nr:hypothetical protein [Lachnospiraceae bacterium]